MSFLRELLRKVMRHELAISEQFLNHQLQTMKAEIMSALSDANDSLTALSSKVDAALAAKGDPAVAQALADDEAGLVSLKAGLDALGAKIDAALTPTPPA